LFGCDSFIFIVESSIEHIFSLTVYIKNRKDIYQWCLTIVYDPVNSTLKTQFWEELRSLGNNIQQDWLVCGDFNVIRSRAEKSGSNFFS
jgi:hypothetical protein